MQDASTHPARSPAEEPAISGSVIMLLQFDVCEEIHLSRLRQILAAPALTQPPRLSCVLLHRLIRFH